MIDPTLTISIDRTGMAGAPAPLAFSARLDGTTLGIVAYSPPAQRARVEYMPDNANIHGSEAIGAALQQSILTFAWIRNGATAESQIATSLAEVAAAIQRLSFTVTTQVAGAPAQAWAANYGSIDLDANVRTLNSIKYLVPVYAVSIPVYPIAGV